MCFPCFSYVLSDNFRQKMFSWWVNLGLVDIHTPGDLVREPYTRVIGLVDIHTCLGATPGLVHLPLYWRGARVPSMQLGGAAPCHGLASCRRASPRLSHLAFACLRSHHLHNFNEDIFREFRICGWDR